MAATPHASVRRRAFVDRRACPMALTAEILGDRWTLLILREAFYGVQRYDDMLVDLGAPRATLTDRLAKLVDAGLLERQAYKEPGSRVRHAYGLTDKGRDTALIMTSMMQWGEKHVIGKPAPAMVADPSNEVELRAGFVRDEGLDELPEGARLVPRDDVR